MFSPLALPALLLLAAAASDLRRREIPDAIPIALALLGAGHAATTGGGAALLPACGMAGAALLAGLPLFGTGQLGGGDVKLIAATMFWLPPSHALAFLIATAVAGGALCLAVAAGRFASVAHSEGFAAALSAARRATAPYAVAIAAGGLAALPWGGAQS
jgi:prepilin peptidase CpaA